MATTTATQSRTTTRVFPLQYFVLAFAFTWALWVPAALEARDLVPSLPVPRQRSWAPSVRCWPPW